MPVLWGFFYDGKWAVVLCGLRWRYQQLMLVEARPLQCQSVSAFGCSTGHFYSPFTVECSEEYRRVTSSKAIMLLDYHLQEKPTCDIPVHASNSRPCQPLITMPVMEMVLPLKVSSLYAYMLYKLTALVFSSQVCQWALN